MGLNRKFVRGILILPHIMQHRYCTPPPLDPAFTEPSTGLGTGFPSNMLTRNPSISDYLPLFEEPPPPPPVGSQENPMIIDDAGEGSRQAAHKRRGKEADEAPTSTAPRRSPRSTSQVPTARRASSGSQGKPYPTTSPNSSSTSTASSPQGSQRKGKASASPRKGRKTPARKKAAGKKFVPSVCSPLSQAAFTAATPTPERSLGPTPPPQEVHGRWYIPPRKHSTGSISAESESSSDESDSEPDYGAMYYSR